MGYIGLKTNNPITVYKNIHDKVWEAFSVCYLIALVFLYIFSLFLYHSLKLMKGLPGYEVQR